MTDAPTPSRPRPISSLSTMLRPAPTTASLRMSDRRVADRAEVQRPCKIQRRGASPFDSARTVNLSTSGALIELRTARPPAVGEELALAVAWTPSPVIGADALVPARVIRAARASTDEKTVRVAVEFLRAHALTLAA